MKHALSAKIGIVSGIGPLAGADILHKVLKFAALHYSAVEDSEYPEIILVNHGIAGVDNTAALNSKFQAEVIAMVNQLVANDATILGIACNTAHVYLDKMDTSKQVKIVNLLDQVAQQAGELPEHKYLLLTSSASRDVKLYHPYLHKHAVEFGEVSDTTQALLDEIIGLVMAYKLIEAGQKMSNVLYAAKRAGYSAVIAGCTELPIAIANCSKPSGLEILESNEILAQALLEKYYSRQHVKVTADGA